MRRPGELIAVKSELLKLGAKDIAILNVLVLNSRTPLARIAKYLKTSTEVVSYHYKQLINRSIIADTFAVVDTELLGIYRYCIYFQFKAVSQNKMNQIIAELLKNPNINWIIETGGRWELVIMVQTCYPNLFDKILEKILDPLRQYTNDYFVALVKNFVHKSPRYIDGFKSVQAVESKICFPYNREFKDQKSKPVKLDAKDVHLLVQLHHDARKSLTDIGKELNLSKDAVDDRIRNLIKTGYIKGFISRLNYHSLGVQYVTIMLKLHTSSLEKKRALLNYLYEDIRFYALMEQIGPWDLSLMMFFANPKDLRSFIIDLKERFEDLIHSHESVLHFDQYLYTSLAQGAVNEILSSNSKPL